MPLGILRFGVDGGATSSMVRRFTIVDHLTSTATDSPSSCEEDVAPLGLSDFLKEIEYPTISGSEQRPTTTSFAPAAAPAATGNSVGDDVVPSVGLPCSDEDDVMDPDELYRRILLQHPDLTAPLLTGVPVANAEATPCHPDVSDQALDAIETSDEPVILVSSPRPRLGPRSQHLGTTCTPAAAPDKPVKERHRHELDPALADILRRHNELQRKRTAIMTHPTIQKQLKSFWSMCVKPTVAEGCATAPGLARDGYHQFYATLLGGLTTDWDVGLGASILHRGWEYDRRGMERMDVSCFCASLYFFVEHWVTDTTLTEYQRVLKRLREILQAPATTIGQPRSCHESHGGDSPPCTPATAPPLGAQMSLLQFHQKLQLQAEQKALQVLLGKSMDFDASAYLRYVLQQQQPKPSCPPPRRHSNFVCAGNAHVQGLRPIQSVAQIQINVKAKVRPATGGSVRRDSAPDTKKPMPALCRPLIHPKSAGKDKVRSVHPLPQL
ncbi:hypothetical protein H310_03263 [Aphanomyces invadans]|uniref:Uncharacterized protein n=1 Tax=Aphanomyces invadans TaxID=157072 RepID=A0A024UH40_9STRA|nr:hypothetical protein H310_03263 [Aphanomyces invadans]ETW05505.1 hypothetical protein H310_03263 [Aphanomyces invadans]|eukprot:XP_008865282.1 hypothetical protein H310_03263 [Aphanomyces invadans]